MLVPKVSSDIRNVSQIPRIDFCTTNMLIYPDFHCSRGTSHVVFFTYTTPNQINNMGSVTVDKSFYRENLACTWRLKRFGNIYVFTSAASSVRTLVTCLLAAPAALRLLPTMTGYKGRSEEMASPRQRRRRSSRLLPCARPCPLSVPAALQQPRRKGGYFLMQLSAAVCFIIWLSPCADCCSQPLSMAWAGLVSQCRW